MQSKSLLIAVAAFALTASGVYAYGGPENLEKAGLTKEQIQAFVEARDLKQAGDMTGARDRLVEAGVTEDVIRAVYRANKTTRNSKDIEIPYPNSSKNKTLHSFPELSNEQADALQVARQANDKETVRAILAEAGIERR